MNTTIDNLIEKANSIKNSISKKLKQEKTGAIEEAQKISTYIHDKKEQFKKTFGPNSIKYTVLSDAISGGIGLTPTIINQYQKYQAATAITATDNALLDLRATLYEAKNTQKQNFFLVRGKRQGRVVQRPSLAVSGQR